VLVLNDKLLSTTVCSSVFCRSKCAILLYMFDVCCLLYTTKCATMTTATNKAQVLSLQLCYQLMLLLCCYVHIQMAIDRNCSECVKVYTPYTTRASLVALQIVPATVLHHTDYRCAASFQVHVLEVFAVSAL
jgi:hypothetical protein